MWLVATLLGSTGKVYFHHWRKCYWTLLVELSKKKKITKCFKGLSYYICYHSGLKDTETIQNVRLQDSQVSSGRKFLSHKKCYIFNVLLISSQWSVMEKKGISQFRGMDKPWSENDVLEVVPREQN